MSNPLIQRCLNTSGLSYGIQAGMKGEYIFYKGTLVQRNVLSLLPLSRESSLPKDVFLEYAFVLRRIWGASNKEKMSALVLL